MGATAVSDLQGTSVTLLFEIQDQGITRHKTIPQACRKGGGAGGQLPLPDFGRSEGAAGYLPPQIFRLCDMPVPLFQFGTNNYMIGLSQQ